MMMWPAGGLRRSTWATPAPMAHCSAPLGDREHAPGRAKLAKRACGWLAAALPPAPEHVVTPVERTSVKEPSTESLGVTHDVARCYAIFPWPWAMHNTKI